MSVTLICGNGGDYEYQRDAYYWDQWVRKNMGPITFRIIPHKDADKGILTFEDESLDIIFKLKAPQWISHKDI